MAAQAAPLPRPLQSWAKWMQAAGNSQKTIDTRTSAIRSLLTHAGRTDPVSITTMELVEWLADCRSRWTRTTYSKSARAWHRWLVEQGLRDDDPTARLPAERGYWFPSRDRTGHVRPNSVSRTISQTFRRAGHDVTAHQLRHWFGTHALRVAKDVRVAQELLRHASLQSTQMYTKVSDQRKAETVRRLTLAFRSR